MKLSDITLKNIKAFVEGNARMLGDNFGVVDKHIQEQVAYRAALCSDCMEAGKCTYCGCKVPGKLYVKESCNKGDRFPNMMDKEEWEEYKNENNIDI